MISIIICSRSGLLNKNLIENIESTIGCDFELIAIDNSSNKLSISEAYNLGIERSKGNLLCFMHEDISIHSIGWGNTLHEIFENINGIGLLGVAGSKIKTKMPSAWWDCPPKYHVINIIQHFKNKERQERNYGFQNSSEVEVAVIDGVFMVMAKKGIVKFNSKVPGFHTYDLSASVENKIEGYKVYVTNKIDIEHFSSGSINREWYLTTAKFHDIYRNQLPVTTMNSQDQEENRSLEFVNGSQFIMGLLDNNLNKEAFYWWIKLLKIKLTAKFHIKVIRRLLKNTL